MADESGDALESALLKAQSGLRSDVLLLISALEGSTLVIPLARDVPNVPEGEEVALSEAFAFAPHVLVDPEGGLHLALFSGAELLERFGERLGWRTEGGDLKYCTLAAEVALKMALDVVDGQRVLGVVVNPAEDSELVLTRRELASIAQGEALPLVGYVREIPERANAETLIAEGQGALPAAFVAALDACLALSPEVASHRLERSFNRERDLEPHPTLVLGLTQENADRRILAERIVAAVQNHLPSPGYIDILFDD